MASQKPDLINPFPSETSIVRISFDELQFAEVRAGYEFWQELRGARRFPSRDDVQPRKVAGLLRHMMLVKVLDNAEDFLLKIVGDEVAWSYCAPLNNRLMSEVEAELPNTTRRYFEIYRHVARTGEPLAVRVAVGFETQETKFTQAETICLPLGPDDDCIDHLLTFGRRTAQGAGFPI